jgi:DNA-binding Lrp family transcriptional regulator
MKERELHVLQVLRNNARETLTHISRKTGVPISTLFDRLNEYRDRVIIKHTCLIDYTKLGYDLRVHMLLRVQKERERFETYITTHFLVNSVFRINNGYDYLVEAVFKNMREMTEFVQHLEKFHIKDHKEFFVLEDLKREAFLTTDTHVKMLAAAPVHHVR